MLVDTIKSDLGKAMKAGDKQKVSCLRMIMSAFKYKQVELKHELSEQDQVQILRTQIKQVRESLDQYKQGGREDLASVEEQNLAILKSYLPEQLSDEAIAFAREIRSGRLAQRDAADWIRTNLCGCG